MLGFNFLQSENYAAYEPFVNSQKKEKFTVAELESLVDTDEDMDNDNSNSQDTTTTEPVDSEDMVMMEADSVNEEQDIVLVEEDIPIVPSTEPVDEEEGDEEDENLVMMEGDTEGFQGSKSVEYKFMKRVLIFLALFGLSYVLFKMYKLHKHETLNVIHTRINRFRIGKLRLDADIVMALLGATALFLLLRLIDKV